MEHRRRLASNLLRLLSRACAEQGLVLAHDIEVPGVGHADLLARDANGRARLGVRIVGSDDDGRTLLGDAPKSMDWLTADALAPHLHLTIPTARTATGWRGTTRLATPSLSPSLRLNTPDVELPLSEVYEGVIEARPAAARLRVVIDLDLVSENPIDTGALADNIAHMVAHARDKGFLNDPGQMIARLGYRIEGDDGATIAERVVVDR